jgi:hypothetical protein
MAILTPLSLSVRGGVVRCGAVWCYAVSFFLPAFLCCEQLKKFNQALCDHALNGVQGAKVRKQYIDGIFLTKFDTVRSFPRFLFILASPVR